MAWDDELKGNWSPRIRRAWKSAFDVSNDILVEPFITGMFEVGWLMKDIPDQVRNGARSSLRDYLWRTYRLRLDAVFDWDAWREAYDSASV
jgi:hypothetical protein